MKCLGAVPALPSASADISRLLALPEASGVCREVLWLLYTHRSESSVPNPEKWKDAFQGNGVPHGPPPPKAVL